MLCGQDMYPPLLDEYEDYLKDYEFLKKLSKDIESKLQKATENPQEKFCRELIDSVKEHLLNNLKKVPEEWDGLELRWFIANEFRKVVFESEYKESERYEGFINFLKKTDLRTDFTKPARRE